MTGQEEHMLTHFLINLGDLVGGFVLERHLEGVAQMLDVIAEGRNVEVLG
jgi:hypothetical protein